MATITKAPSLQPTGLDGSPLPEDNEAQSLRPTKTCVERTPLCLKCVVYPVGVIPVCLASIACCACNALSYAHEARTYNANLPEQDFTNPNAMLEASLPIDVCEHAGKGAGKVLRWSQRFYEMCAPCPHNSPKPYDPLDDYYPLEPETDEQRERTYSEQSGHIDYNALSAAADFESAERRSLRLKENLAKMHEALNIGSDRSRTV